MVQMPPDCRAGSGEMIAMNVQGLGDVDDLTALDLSDFVHGCRTGSYPNGFLERGRPASGSALSMAPNSPRSSIDLSGRRPST